MLTPASGNIGQAGKMAAADLWIVATHKSVSDDTTQTQPPATSLLNSAADATAAKSTAAAPLR